MKTISLNEFNRMTLHSTVLAEDSYGKKVFQLEDESIIKLFRIKRFWSKAMIFSPAQKFARNAYKLARLHIPSVSVIDVFRIKSLKRTAVHYQSLPGQTVRDYLQANIADEAFFFQLGQFLAELHNLGIYFRSAHFGNIIYTAEKFFGLIDISDMSISPIPLNSSKRLRNLKHIFRLAEDQELITHADTLQQSYLKHSSIQSAGFRKKFSQVYGRQFEVTIK